jgi:cytochrome c oxidase subunit 4
MLSTWGKVLIRGIKIQSNQTRSLRNFGPVSVNGSFTKYFEFTNATKTSLRKYSVRSKEIETDVDNEDEYYVDVSNLETRWPSLTFEVQQDIISYLNVKQEFGWEYLTNDEKKAIYYIAYGNWGPRDQKIMSTAEFVFKLMTNMLLFSVLGFSLMNYAIDQEKIAELEKQEENLEGNNQ